MNKQSQRVLALGRILFSSDESIYAYSGIPLLLLPERFSEI